MISTMPTLLFYCQHSLGMGHLVRTLHVIDALRQHFHVVLLSGGRMPAGISVAPDVELIELPPLGMDEASRLVSLDPAYSVEQSKIARRDLILAAFHRNKPSVLIVELYPFGRKKFADEIVPLLEAARHAHPKTTVLCSLRDILVSDRQDQAAYDARAVDTINRYFDGILLHADPHFARLEESCSAITVLRKPVYYTGFVTERQDATPLPRSTGHILISAGGGMVGRALFETVLDAHALSRARTKMGLRIVTGPFYPEADWLRLFSAAQQFADVEVIRALPSLTFEMQRAAASISQCGYNTAMDLMRTRVPALVVPFATKRENEQGVRAARLGKLGLLRVLPAHELQPERMAREMEALLAFKPAVGNLDLDGALNTAQITRRLQAEQALEGAQA